jgi:queuine/archaeosine tRNA-ribosyltransferase
VVLQIQSDVTEDIAVTVDRTRPTNGRQQRARTSTSNVYQQEEGTWKDHELMEKRKL